MQRGFVYGASWVYAGLLALGGYRMARLIRGYWPGDDPGPWIKRTARQASRPRRRR